MKLLAKIVTILLAVVISMSLCIVVYAKDKEEKLTVEALYDIILALESRIDDLETDLNAKDAELSDLILALESRIDETTLQAYYRDEDGDGFGITTDFQILQQATENYSALVGGDFDDSDASCYPGAPELLDGLDNDGDGLVDEGFVTYYYDADQDGYGLDGNTLMLTEPTGSYTALIGGDFDDDNSTCYPGAPELLDSLDNNNDGQIDEPYVDVYYRDEDGDGYGVDGDIQVLTEPTGFYTALKDGDFDDESPSNHPGADELLDDADNDGDGLTDEKVNPLYPNDVYYLDADRDGYGVNGYSIIAPSPSGLYTATEDGDFDDNDSRSYRGAAEIDDDMDNDGDGWVDEGLH